MVNMGYKYGVTKSQLGKGETKSKIPENKAAEGYDRDPAAVKVMTFSLDA